LKLRHIDVLLLGVHGHCPSVPV